MSFLCCVSELLFLGIISLDTIGFLAHIRKSSVSPNVKDYTRLCFTWIFYFVIRTLTCTSCEGYCAGLLRLVGFLGKVYITIPALNGTMTIYHQLIEENKAAIYLTQVCKMIKEKCGCCAQEVKRE